LASGIDRAENVRPCEAFHPFREADHFDPNANDFSHVAFFGDTQTFHVGSVDHNRIRLGQQI
jgi:hypothetical protein